MTHSIRLCENHDWPRVIELLLEVYVGGGFTPAERRGAIFRRDRIEPGGSVLIAAEDEDVLGVIVLLDADSPMDQIAREDEAEFRLLAVSPRGRGRGIGEQLVAECIRRAARAPRSVDRLVIWTQPRMVAAQRLYERVGFTRAAEREQELPPHPSVIERWVYTLEL